MTSKSLSELWQNVRLYIFWIVLAFIIGIMLGFWRGEHYLADHAGIDNLCTLMGYAK